MIQWTATCFRRLRVDLVMGGIREELRDILRFYLDPELMICPLKNLGRDNRFVKFCA